MITPITFAFLNAVKENNNLEWMNKNKISTLKDIVGAAHASTNA